MAPKYNPGDKVKINGIEWTIRTWPSDDQGPFFADREDPKCGTIQGTQWTGMIDSSIEEIQEPADVELVSKSEGPVVSTAGELPAIDEAEAEPAVIEEPTQ